MSNQPKKAPCSIALLAHVDAGKTTLSEALLYQSGARRTLGRVDHADAFLDTHALERARGITIFSKQARLATEHLDVTLVDTPGHVDFSAEIERSLWALDAAVIVVCSVSGVQPQTELLFQALQKENIPFCAGILYTNDLDYRLARLLSTEVIEEKPFAEISDDAFVRAMAQVHSCKTVINAGVDIGVCNKRIQELIDAAQSLSKLQRGYWH